MDSLTCIWTFTTVWGLLYQFIFVKNISYKQFIPIKILYSGTVVSVILELLIYCVLWSVMIIQLLHSLIPETLHLCTGSGRTCSHHLHLLVLSMLHITMLFSLLKYQGEICCIYGILLCYVDLFVGCVFLHIKISCRLNITFSDIHLFYTRNIQN